MFTFLFTHRTAFDKCYCKHVARSNKEVEAKLHEDIILFMLLDPDVSAAIVNSLVAAVFIKISFLVKNRIWAPNWGLKEFKGGNLHSFSKRREEKGSNLMLLVILLILGMSINHEDRVVMNLGGGT